MTKLREKKLLDKLTSYASSDIVGAKLELAAAESIAQACSFQISIRFLRDDLDRVMRIDRAQVSLQLGQYLSDWAFPLKVRPGQENLQEASVLDRVKAISDEIFTEQFRRNLHAFLLTTGERAQLEVRMIQRLQLKLFRAPGAPAQEVFVRPSVYLVFLGSQPTSQIKANTSWELTSDDVDDRISRRWSMINWLSFRSDAELVEMSIKVSPKNAPQLSSDQGYSIRSKRTRSTRKIEILAAANEGAFNALARLERMGLEGRIAEDFQLTESPALKYRALIEDRAISRMTHRDRLEMMQLLGRLRLNRLYLFGNGYKPEKIAELSRAANANFVELVYVFKAASVTPVEEIENEISQLRQGGVRSFALDFESTGDPTRISEDAALIARIRASLQARYPESRLSVILRSAAPEDKYVSEIAQAISPDIELVIADDTITGESSSLLNKRIVSVTALSGNSRTESTQCLNLLPGTYHNPGSTAEGVSARLTQQTRMSLMLLPSFAEFAWEPASYNSRSSFDQTLNLLFDERSRNGIRSWAQVVGDCSRDNPLSAITIKNSPDSAARKLADLRSAIEQLNGTPERGLLRAELAELIARAQTVLDKFKSR
ncbi:MAG: beta-N-acetylglucosaminidase domain-containing protein [Acidobacteria bacterium]|nr:beta-N-acetylglucosaminidase domain-containing protein [Acidobacteriota bacterium]